MTSLADLNKSINLLQEKIDSLIVNLGLTADNYVTTKELEIASAKIINDFSNELEDVSEKIISELSKKLETCPCNEDILEAISDISNTEIKQSSFSYKGLTRHVPPYADAEETSVPFSALVAFNKK